MGSTRRRTASASYVPAVGGAVEGSGVWVGVVVGCVVGDLVGDVVAEWVAEVDGLGVVLGGLDLALTRIGAVLDTLGLPEVSRWLLAGFAFGVCLAVVPAVGTDGTRAGTPGMGRRVCSETGPPLMLTPSMAAYTTQPAPATYATRRTVRARCPVVSTKTGDRFAPSGGNGFT